jgi:hypothetical protein
LTTKPRTIIRHEIRKWEDQSPHRAVEPKEDQSPHRAVEPKEGQSPHRAVELKLLMKQLVFHTLLDCLSSVRLKDLNVLNLYSPRQL